MGNRTDWDSKKYNISSALQAKYGDRFWDKLSQFYTLKANDSVLDIGAGTGRFMVNTLRQNPDIKTIYGLDVSDNMLKVAQENLDNENLSNYNLIHQSIEVDNKELYNKFNVAYSNYCFHWVENKAQALNNVINYLKPNGVFGLNIGQPGLIRLTLYFMGQDKTWNKYGLLDNYKNINIENYSPLTYELAFYKKYLENKNVKLLHCELAVDNFTFDSDEDFHNLIKYGITPNKIPTELLDQFAADFIDTYSLISGSKDRKISIVDLQIIGQRP